MFPPPGYGVLKIDHADRVLRCTTCYALVGPKDADRHYRWHVALLADVVPAVAPPGVESAP